jgi:hypothetical protein
MPDIPDSHWDHVNRSPKVGSEWQTIDGARRATITAVLSQNQVAATHVGAARAWTTPFELYYCPEPPEIRRWEPVAAEPVTYTQEQVDIFLEVARQQARNAVLADIQQANEILNSAATDAELCSSYEDALDRVNRAVSTFKLHGRQKEHRVDFYVQLPPDALLHGLETAIDNWLTEHGFDACTGFDWNEAER